ncbi:MAG: alpha/beta fold hydrolase, partial [Hyphomicrobiales bacterium]
MAGEALDAAWRDIHFTSQDGLSLYVRHYRAREGSHARPVLCLPGLTRNGRDFSRLADHLTTGAGLRRDVYCVDYRGRGQSAYDRNWKNYTPYIEALDVIDFVSIAGLHDAAIVGTSRGGIIAMLMAVMRPSALGAVVLNDIGPEVETAGLARIVGYVGRTPPAHNWDEAAELAKGMSGKFFPEIPAGDWPQIARQWFAEKDGKISPDYDPQLARTMAALDLTRPIPAMWAQFSALGRVPAMAIRGETSDLLSEETLARMRASHPSLETLLVEGQG